MLVVVVIEAVSDIVAKEWSLRDKTWLFVVALSGYILTNLFWLWALKNDVGLARGAVIFSAGSAILGVVSGFLIYKETFTVLETIGIMLGLLSLIFIFWK